MAKIKTISLKNELVNTTLLSEVFHIVFQATWGCIWERTTHRKSQKGRFVEKLVPKVFWSTILFFYSIKSDFCDRYYAHLMWTVARQRCVNAFISSAIIILERVQSSFFHYVTRDGWKICDTSNRIEAYINHSKIFYLPINFGIPVYKMQYLCTVLRFIDFSSLPPASDSMLQ